MHHIEWLTRLIAFDTTSRNSNLALIHTLADWFEQFNLPISITKDETAQKANLFITIPAQDGNTTHGGLIFSGHTDVVPVDGQAWDSDPFTAQITTDRLFGRGACDMKGFLAAMLALVPEWTKTQRDYPLHLAFSYDEEVGCLGARKIIEDLATRKIFPAACIVGEPTDMQMVVAHKGIQVFQCTFIGKAAHSSLTTMGCNAIEYAAELIAFIRSLANQFKHSGPFDADYDVAFSTLTTNRVQGGIADNIIPESCSFCFEFRNLPEVSAEQVLQQIKHHVAGTLLPAMQKEFPEALIEINPISTVPALEFKRQDSLIQLVQSLVEEKAFRKVSYATEAGLFQRAGIPTIVCGPGNIQQAHRPNEFVLLSQMERCENFLRQVALPGNLAHQCE